MRFLISLLFSLVPLACHATPEASYVPNCFIRPCEIKGDFDGDGKIDRAILVQNKAGKKGIEIKFANHKTKVIGAGRTIGSGGDDFSWMDHWSIHKGGIEQGAVAKMPPTIKIDSLFLEQTRSASGIVYWSGSDFEWFQQGD